MKHMGVLPQMHDLSILLFGAVAMVVLASCTAVASQSLWESHGPLEVSPNGRYLQHADGTPFFWLGDTAWGLAERVTREQVDAYLDDRAARGFNVVQFCLFWGKRNDEVVGQSTTLTFTANPQNAYGHRALDVVDGKPDPSRPAVVPGGTPTSPNDYWDHVDYIVQAAADRGITLAVLPVWGRRYVNATHRHHSEALFNPANAKVYGAFVGTRYRHAKHIIWVIGGDVDSQNGTDQRPTYRAMAEGIGKGVTGVDVSYDKPAPAWNGVLMTYHHPNRSSTTGLLHDAWYDFNFVQSHHALHAVARRIATDYATEPAKPALLGEPAYEGVIARDPLSSGLVTAQCMRQQAYHAVLSGSCGFTYGYGGTKAGKLYTMQPPYEEQLNAPGAQQMTVLKRIMTSLPWWKLVPAQSLIAGGLGSGLALRVASRSVDGELVLVYCPAGVPVSLRLAGALPGSEVVARWIDPRDGTGVDLGRNAINAGPVGFTLPTGWEDGLLVLRPVQ